MKKIFCIILLAVVALAPAFCQQLLPAMDRFSEKKPGHLITMKGERIDFVLTDLDRKKRFNHQCRRKNIRWEKI